jgi:ABC-type multidrug transport system fused ATPase/permease subunit
MDIVTLVGLVGLALTLLGMWLVWRTDDNNAQNPRNLVHVDRMGHPFWWLIYVGAIVVAVCAIGFGFDGSF